MIVRIPLIWAGIAECALWPLLIVDSSLDEHEAAKVIVHGGKHLEQQWAWIKRFAPVGAVAWLSVFITEPSVLVGACIVPVLLVGLWMWLGLYWLALPVWRNPWREQWEREAFAANGIAQEHVTTILRGWPYCLWGLR